MKFYLLAVPREPYVFVSLSLPAANRELGYLLASCVLASDSNKPRPLFSLVEYWANGCWRPRWLSAPFCIVFLEEGRL